MSGSRAARDPALARRGAPVPPPGTLALLARRFLRSRGKPAFLHAVRPGAKVLDVGCGNNSPMQFKMQRPDLWYIGLDIGDYNQQTPQHFADEYVIVGPEHFAAAIRRFQAQLDAVVSAHNLEHCYAPDEVLEAMLEALKPGGRLYLSFPCEESVAFPRRAGTLNFYDDATHRQVPQWRAVLDRIRRGGLQVDFAAKRYRPFFMRCVGLAAEPLSAARKTVMRGTWDLYGFESVVWASRPGQP